jgi:6,7-dimethyl-8-ribityllumazine synthase
MILELGVIGALIRPGRARIEYGAVDTFDSHGNGEPEIRIGAVLGAIEEPSSAALSRARVALIGMRWPSP